ncbi:MULTISPECIES: helix-turn-helix domain-containing protein [Bradyrhizobium]|nr:MULTISPECIES: helix-turn-helix domain-containing protein [Bradyrhizobium]MDI2077566.1 helix-turn-helix domain-containing protein [Bradyrhizobium sp. Mp27]
MEGGAAGEGQNGGAADVGTCAGSGSGGRRKAAKNCGMDSQTLRDWGHRYNVEGLAGLRSRNPPDPFAETHRAAEDELAGLSEPAPLWRWGGALAAD